MFLYANDVVLMRPEGVRLSQRHYLQELIYRYGISDCKIVPTPAPVKSKYGYIRPESSGCYNPRYQERFGCLLFLVKRSIPDISLEANVLAHHLSELSEQYMVAAKRVLIYLHGI